MMDTTRSFFDELTRTDSPHGILLQRLQGSYRFDLDDDGSFHVRFVDGRVEVRESRDDADCVLALSEEDLVDLAAGRRNLITSFLQGRVRLRGSMVRAEALHAFLRAALQDRRQAASSEARP